MNIERALQDYITEHEINNCSDHTIQGQSRVLNRFITWLKVEHGIVDTDDLRVTHLRGWMGHLQKTENSNEARLGRSGKPLKSTSVKNYVVIMLSFCHWLEHEGIIEKPITQRFKLPKTEVEFIPTFTPDEVNKLLEACEARYRGKPELTKAITARNRAIVSVLIDTGIRRSELVKLRLCDVDREMRILLIHRKGNKWQQVPISREGFKALHEYLTKYRPYLAKLAGQTIARKEDAVFLTEHGSPLSRDGLSGIFKTLKKRTGIDDKRVSPHNCRRYMATTQISMGRSPFDVQRQMGHTTLTMTNRYVSQTIENLKKSHEEYSPFRAKKNNDSNHTGSGYWDE